MENTAATSLYDLLVTKDFEPEMLDSSGRDVSDPKNAEMFSFEFQYDGKDYGTVVALFGKNNELEIFYGDSLGRSLEGDARNEWYRFLAHMKDFAVRNMLKFELNDIGRLKYTMQGIAAIKEGLFEGYHGRRNISYNRAPTETRIMIRHNRDLAEGEPRHRAIESIYIETAGGERFRVPTRSLTHARMLERHVCEGGNPYDIFGQHISSTVKDMGTLGRFLRATRGREFTGGTKPLVDAAVKHYSDLKDKAKRMISHRGYYEERDQFDPAEILERDHDVNHIREMFIERNIDNRIEDALPILSRLANGTTENDMKEIKEFENWATGIVEGTWALPDTPDTQQQLQNLLSAPLIVGADAANATEKLYDLIGDDILFDRLHDLADRDPNANCWEDPEIINRLGELGIDINPTVGPDSGEQGVTEGEERVDTLVTKGLGLMRGPTWLDAVAAIKYQVGERDYRERKEFYDFFVRQLVDRYGKKGVTEGEEHSPVAGAITRRIMSQRLDLLKKYGPVKVTQAIDDVADFVGDTDEIGSSDVSGWVRQVEQTLGGMSEQGLAEGFGSNYAEQLAQKVFDQHPGLENEDDILKAGYAIAKQELGDRAAGTFRDEDFPSDLISAYNWVKEEDDYYGLPNRDGSNEDVGENLDTDGVMMTRPSNMSSESVDPLLRLKQLAKL